MAPRPVLAARLATWTLPAVAVAAPLACAPALVDSFELVKLSVLETGLAVALLALALGSRFRSGLPRTVAVLAAALFLGLNALATLTSIEPRTALLGTYGHDQGLLTLAVQVAYFFLAASWLRDEAALARFAAALAVTAALISAYAVAQHRGLDPLGWAPLVGDTRRTYGTVGHPNQLGEFLAMTLPLTVWLFVRTRGRRRDLWLAAGGLQLVALVLSQARVAWFTVVLQAVTAVVVLGWSRRDSRWARPIGVAAALLMSAVAVASLLLLLAVPTSAQLGESLAGRVLARGETLQARQAIWRSTLAMIADRPWLGWGPDTFRLVYPAYRSPAVDELERVVGRDDAAHDVLLDVAFDAGLPSLAVYLLLLTAVLRLLLGGLFGCETCRARLAALPILLVWTGYLLLFVFGQPRILTNWLAWVVGGAAIGLFAHRIGVGARLPGPARVLAAAFAAGLLLEAGTGLAADLAAGRARDLGRRGLLDASTALLRSATALRPFEPSYHQALGASLAELGRRTADAAALRASLDTLGRASALSGGRDAYLFALMSNVSLDLEVATGGTGAGALEYARRAIELDPLNPLLHATAAEAALRAGRPAQARISWERARDLARSPDALARVGDVASQMGEVDGALAAYREAALRSIGLPDQAALYVAWGRTAILAGRSDEAADAFARALELTPGETSIRIARAEALAAAGRRPEALAEAQRALATQPDNRRAADLVRRLSGS